MGEIRELRKRYFEILDGNEVFGNGNPREQARRFWLEHLAEPIIEQARRKLDDAGKLPVVDLLVSVAGFSPETTIISVGVFRPQEVLVLSAGDAYKDIDTIGDFVLARYLRPSQFRPERCSLADLSPFEKICSEVRAHRERSLERRGGQGGVTVIDITGGKKLMSAAAAMAAWELDLPLSYVNNEFDKARRVAIPGTEEMVVLDSAFVLYGTSEMARADHDFDMGAYEGARTRYNDLANRLSEPSSARFMREWASFYEAWRNMDMAAVQNAVGKLRLRLDDSIALVRKHRGRIEEQLKFVERLVKGERATLIMTLFLLADANMAVGRYDFSALLFYRTIEASIASRLESAYDGFLCEEPDYSKLRLGDQEIKERFAVAAREVLGRPDSVELPVKVGCLDGAILLRALKDPLLEQAKLGEAKALARLRDLAKARNQSILAHGYGSVTERDCNALKTPARDLLGAYWTLNNETMPFKKAVETLRFVRLEE